MSILIVQLSDLHASTGNEKIFTIQEELYRAIRAELSEQTEACAIVFNGDAAYGGKPSEFLLASTLLQTLREQLADASPNLKLYMLTVPGNHDCDLTSEDTKARETLRATITSEMPSASVLRILLDAQTEYFKFSQSIEVPNNSFSELRPFFRSIDISLSDGIVRFDLLNSSWTSLIHETDDLKFPLKTFDPPKTPEAQYVVAVLHHPPHWFKMPGVRRELRDLLETHADLVLTGHEHENEASSRAVEGGGEIAYTEGGVLYDSHRADLITFNTIEINFARDSQQIKRFRFSGGHFKNEGPQESSSLQTNRFRLDREFRLRVQFEQWLDEFEDPLTHPREEEMSLSDLFAYPDLRKVTDQSGPKEASGKRNELIQIIKSNKVFAEFEQYLRAFVTGGDKSGKTTIAKRLFKDLHAAGQVPVFLVGSELSRRGDSNALRKQIGAAVVKQYQFVTPEAYEQLDIARKVVIIDDIQQGPGDAAVKQKIFEFTQTRFHQTIITASNDFFLELIGSNSSSEIESLYNFQRYEIADFGKQRFEELAMRWTELGRKDDDPENVRVAALDLCDKVHSLLAMAGLPHTPWLLLVILEQNESPDATIAAKNGDIGHLYNAVITIKLSQSTFKRFNLTGKFTYLSELAYEFYSQNRGVIREQEFRAFHARHAERFDLVFDFEQVRDDLVDTRMLRVDGDEVAFRHKFVFAFFVAYWISRNIHKDDAQDIVRKLCSRLDYEISSNVLVFLSHLTDNPIVLTEMKLAASKLLAGSKVAKMKEDVSSLNALSTGRKIFALPLTPPKVNRRLAQEMEDEAVARSMSSAEQDGRLLIPLPPEEDAERQKAHQALKELRAALKTIRILGQVLRNKALATESVDKVALMEELLLLDRRAMGFIYGFLSDLKVMVKDLRRRIVRAGVAVRLSEIKEAAETQTETSLSDARLSKIELRKIWEESGTLAKEFWFDLYAAASYGAIKTAATAIGSRDLDSTVVKVRAQSDSVPTNLIDLCIRMSRRGLNIPVDEFVVLRKEFDKSRNRVAQVVLDYIGWERATFFETAENQRQALCRAMGMDVPKSAYDTSQKRFMNKRK